jgi:hypothetical protein
MAKRRLIGQPEGAEWPEDWDSGPRCSCGHTAWEHNAWFGEPQGFCEGEPPCDCTKRPDQVGPGVQVYDELARIFLDIDGGLQRETP